MRLVPRLDFVATVALRLDKARSVGETPDGLRLHFTVHGTLEGRTLKGSFPACAAYLRIDSEGVGTINVRAPLLLHDGAFAELESTGRYDFGEDGHARALAGELPDSDLGWCPRFVTGDSRYSWLNRTQFLGVGKLLPREGRVDYDLFAMSPRSSTGAEQESRPAAEARPSLYDRLGGKHAIDRVADAFIDALATNQRLHRQNPTIRAALARANLDDLKRKVSDFFAKLAGGPHDYGGRSLKEAHAPLAISEADWTLVGEDLFRILDEHRVPPAERAELLAAIETTKADIVTPSRGAAADRYAGSKSYAKGT